VLGAGGLAADVDQVGLVALDEVGGLGRGEQSGSGVEHGFSLVR
jgi:hypothetical protein